MKRFDQVRQGQEQSLLHHCLWEFFSAPRASTNCLGLSAGQLTTNLYHCNPAFQWNLGKQHLFSQMDFGCKEVGFRIAWSINNQPMPAQSRIPIWSSIPTILDDQTTCFSRTAEEKKPSFEAEQGLMINSQLIPDEMKEGVMWSWKDKTRKAFF